MTYRDLLIIAATLAAFGIGYMIGKEAGLEGATHETVETPGSEVADTLASKRAYRSPADEAQATTDTPDTPGS